MFKRFPFHTLLLAIYIPLALFASNLGEIKPVTTYRLLLVLALFSLILLFLINLFIRDWRKSGLMTSLIVFFFSVYGSLYSFLKSPAVFGGALGHHRIVIFLVLILLAVFSWLVIKKFRHLPEITLLVNLFSFYLVLMPVVQITLFTIQNNKLTNSQAAFKNPPSQAAPVQNDLPDIYHIILDSYQRQDFLAAGYDYDNSKFIQFLKDSDFYVAECSRSNYAHTFLSISSTMNMTYVQDFMTPETLTEPALKDALVRSQVRARLSNLGYQIVAFDNVHWDYSDADVFYKFKIEPILNPYLFPVESVYIDNSALKIFKDFSRPFKQGVTTLSSSAVKDHYLQQEYILDSIDESVSLKSPKYVFGHVEKPHGPFVFEPDGAFIEEDAYYRDKYFSAINKEYDRLGNIKQVEYLNRRMIRLVNEIQEVDKDAIIIIHSDHGLLENEILNGRLANLFAIYFPDKDYSSLYPTITPINIFRVVLDKYFSAGLGLLPDNSYYSYREDKMEYFPIEEDMPGCVQQ